MSDRKITELSALANLEQNDLFVVVDDPAGTPITKKITTASLFGNVTFVTSVSIPSTVVVNSVLTANANAEASAVLSAGKFTVNALSTSQNTAYQYGILVTSKLNDALANVKTEHAAAKLILDVSNAASLVSNTYGLLVKVANTGVRAVQPQAFLGFMEDTSSIALSTKYLFDLGANGSMNVSANLTAGATDSLYTNATSATVTHKLKINVNGATRYILLSSA